MKPNSLFLLVLIMFLTACNYSSKKEITQNNFIPIKPIVVKNKTLTDYLVYEGNSEMTGINNNIYAYLYGMQEVLKQRPQVLRALFNKMKVTTQNGIFLTRFIEGSSQSKDLFNECVSKLFPGRSKSIDFATELSKNMTYKGLGYEPTLVLYNGEKAILEKEYYLALLVEPNENTDTTKEYIPAYHIKSGNPAQLELIEAVNAYNQDVPVFVFQFEINKNYLVPGTRNDYFLAPLANKKDNETYNPVDPVAFYSNPSLGHKIASPNPLVPLNPPSNPIPGIVQNESISISAHHEQYGASEYAMSSRVSYNGGFSIWNEHEHIVNVPRNYVDCGCYKEINQAFINNTSTGQTFSFLTFEIDGWASVKTFQSGTVTFRYKATADTDIYVYSANASTNVDFSGTPPIGKTYISGNGQNIFRRY